MAHAGKYCRHYQLVWQVQLCSSASLCVMLFHYLYTFSEMHARRIRVNWSEQG